MKASISIASLVVLMVMAAVDWRPCIRKAHALDQDDETAQANLDVDPAMVEDMAVAAEKTYQATAAGYDMGTEVLANVYVWSRRWLDAERKLAKNEAEDLVALKAHRERMKLLMTKVRALFNLGAKGGEQERYFATRYYLAEANALLAAAKSHDAPQRKVVVSFRGPKGMVVRWQERSQVEYDSEPLACPGRHEFLEGRLYFLQFSGVGTVKLEALLDLSNASEEPLPVELTIGDVKKIATRHWMRQVFFRRDSSDVDIATDWDEERLAAGLQRDHEVLAVLDIGPQ
ncbi:MAG TPA: hypothetical protein VFI31_14850 [Pirellulales bacterium]|nr:hypothetical protein [Pirellulales bacterium]